MIEIWKGRPRVAFSFTPVKGVFTPKAPIYGAFNIIFFGYDGFCD